MGRKSKQTPPINGNGEVIKFPDTHEDFQAEVKDILDGIKDQDMSSFFIGYTTQEGTAGYAIVAQGGQVDFETFARLYFTSKTVNTTLFNSITNDYDNED